MSALNQVPRGSLGRREARLAYSLLLPTVIMVMAVVLLPLVATFWISVKPIELGDLRPTEPVARERVKAEGDANTGQVLIEYRMRNSSRDTLIEDVSLKDHWPDGLRVLSLPDPCSLAGTELTCTWNTWEAGFRETLSISAIPPESIDDVESWLEESRPQLDGEADNLLTNAQVTFDNFVQVFDSKEFGTTLWITFVYTFGGTLGALVMGLFAAQLMNQTFRGRAVLRGLFLFPYVAPVIAMAFTWLVILDPFSGALNTLLVQMEAIQAPINFFGTRATEVSVLGWTFNFPVALSMVILFEVWRYFPLAFLFILARMQSIQTDMYEAAEIDGATPFQQFWELSLPQLIGIMSVLFLLRFIWTFNKFDDIFLLTGGNAGTRTLTVDVYEQGFALNNLGAGAAVAVVIFLMLAVFSTLYFRTLPKGEGL